MERAIYFVGGVTQGISRFESHMRESCTVQDFNSNNLIGEVLGKLGITRKNGKGSSNPQYYETLEDMKNVLNLSINYEIEETGKAIKNFIESNREILIIHRSSEETRKLFMNEMLDVVKIPVFRIAFGYGDKIPDEYDYLIRPDHKDFEKQLEDIYQIEIGAGL